MKILEDDAAVSALVGDRISPELPQTPTLPAITYKLLDTEQDGVVDFVDVYFQITPWADSYTGAKELEKTIRWALQRYRGRVLGIRIEQILFYTARYVHDPVTGRHTMPADYVLSYWEE